MKNHLFPASVMKSRVAALAFGLCLGSGLSAQAQTRFDFEYRVSDSRINVFDDGKNTRLQLPEGLALPAVISRTPAGEQILTPRRDGVYLVIDGVHAQLALVWANNRQVQVQYTGAMTEARQGAASAHTAMPTAAVTGAVPAPRSVAPVAPDKAGAQVRKAATAAGTDSVPALQTHIEPPAKPTSPSKATEMPQASAQAVQQAASQAAEPVAAPSITFEVRQRDTVRETLARWAKDAGWTHLPEHYTVDFDVQILGSVAPYTDFRAGVRALLNTTSMTSKPLQPCFYSNQVLRVVLRTQRCDQI
jgi:hypothetical protein